MKEIASATSLSLLVALASVFLVVPLALFLSTFLHGRRWRALDVVFLLPLFWSPTVVGYLVVWGLSPNYWFGVLLRDLGIQVVFTLYGTILACCLVSFPLAYQACIIGRSSIPRDTTDAASVLGGTPVYVTFSVLWPQMRPALLVASLLVAARALGEFGASMMVGGNMPGVTRTLPLAVYTLAENQHPEMAGLAATVSAALGTALYLLMRLLSRS